RGRGSQSPATWWAGVAGCRQGIAWGRYVASSFDQVRRELARRTLRAITSLIIQPARFGQKGQQRPRAACRRHPWHDCCPDADLQRGYTLFQHHALWRPQSLLGTADARRATVDHGASPDELKSGP